MKVQDLIQRLKSMPKNADVHVFINRTKSAPLVTEVVTVINNRVFLYIDKLTDK